MTESRARGRGEGRAARDPDDESGELRRLVDLRRSRLVEAGPSLQVLAPCVEAMRARESAALAELIEQAERSLDHLCLDGGLLDTLTGLQLERALGLYFDGPDGPVLGGAWALEPELAAAVSLHPLQLGGERPALAFGVPGGLPLAGISASGFAIVTQSLRPAGFEPGLPGAALLRELLAAPRLDVARELLASAHLADGRNWMLGDGASYYGYEQLQAKAVLTRVGRKVSSVHANHCFDPGLRQLEGRPRSPLSFRRLELASTLYVQRQPGSAAAMLEFFAEVEREAFEDPKQRANCALAVELSSGRALWSCRLGEHVEHATFATPLAPEASP